MVANQRQIDEQSERAQADCNKWLEDFKAIFEPETDYDSDALMFSDPESDTSSSDSSILSDSSVLSSEEEEEEVAGPTKDIDKQKKKVIMETIRTSLTCIKCIVE